MNAAALTSSKPVAFELLLGHCLMLDSQPRPTALDRLEAVLGRDLTRKLVGELSTPR